MLLSHLGQDLEFKSLSSLNSLIIIFNLLSDLALLIANPQSRGNNQ